MENARYLPLFDRVGGCIKRPDLYLLARMAAPDDEDDVVVQQLYEVMLNADNTLPHLNTFETRVVEKSILQNMTLRLAAGQVLLELFRIAATMRKPPSVANAIKLAAFKQQAKTRKSSPDTHERAFRNGFSKYRNTSHLQAAMVLGNPTVWDIETSDENTMRFLARARRLELFIDKSVNNSSFKWEPWRVPRQITAETEIELTRLSEQELLIISPD